MCLKHVGVELPLMKGTRPLVSLRILCCGTAVCKLTLKKDHLRYAAPPPVAWVLNLDKRARGERRPLRHALGRVDRDPYHFYTARLPNGGLHVPDGNLCGNLALELWVDSPQPLWSYPVLFHLKGSNPVVHPFGNRVLWVCHRCWTGAWELGGHITQRDESPCGCCMRTRLEFREYTPIAVSNRHQ